MQILASLSFSAYNYSNYPESKDFIFLQYIMVFVTIVGVKNWVFTMKNWKLSLTVTEMFNTGNVHVLQRYDSIVYFAGISIFVSVPLTIGTLFIFDFMTIAISLFYTWIGLYVGSMYFLIDAYLRLNTIVCDVIKG